MTKSLDSDKPPLSMETNSSENARTSDMKNNGNFTGTNVDYKKH
jgi:hypothetical protein